MNRRQPHSLLRAIPAAAFLAVPLLASAVAAQEGSQAWMERCSRERGRGDRVAYCEVREVSLAAPGLLEVSAAPNGGIEVNGADRRDVHVVARVQSWAGSEAEARALAEAVAVSTDGGRVRASGPRARSGRNEGWAVSFIVSTPRQLDLELETVNGGIAVAGVAGDFELSTTNGGIELDEVAGRVRASTTNGGMDVRLAGERWNGDGLDLQTTNGSIALSVPAGFSADLQARTVHGGIDTDFPVTVQGRIGRSVNARIGDGGPPVRLATTNGGIEIRRR